MQLEVYWSYLMQPKQAKSVSYYLYLDNSQNQCLHVQRRLLKVPPTLSMLYPNPIRRYTKHSSLLWKLPNSPV